MASPQRENGWAPIPYALTDDHLLTSLRESKVLLLAVHETHGFRREQAELQPQYLARQTGLHLVDVRRTLGRLEERGLLERLDGALYRVHVPLSDGWWQLAVELVKVLAYAPLRWQVWRVVFYVARLTYGREGQRATEAPLAASYLASWTGMDPRDVRAALAEAVQLRVLTCVRQGRGRGSNVYRFQKDYEAWRVWSRDRSPGEILGQIRPAKGVRIAPGAKRIPPSYECESPLAMGCESPLQYKIPCKKRNHPPLPPEEMSLPADAGQSRQTDTPQVGAVAPTETARPVGHLDEAAAENAAVAAEPADVPAELSKPADAGAGGRDFVADSNSSLPQPAGATREERHLPLSGQAPEEASSDSFGLNSSAAAADSVTDLATWVLSWMRRLGWPGAQEVEDENRAEVERLGALHGIDALSAGLRECLLQTWHEWQVGEARYPGKVLLPWTCPRTGELRAGKLELHVVAAAALRPDQMHAYRWPRPARMPRVELSPPDFRGTPLDRRPSAPQRVPEPVSVDYVTRLRALEPAELDRRRAVARLPENVPSYLSPRLRQGYLSDDSDLTLLGWMAEQLRRESEGQLVHEVHRPVHPLQVSSGPAADPARWSNARRGAQSPINEEVSP